MLDMVFVFFESDLIRMTALFVARNGRQFLTQLMTREARNFQFDFLKPQHSNFSYFTKLVEQYTKVIIPPNTILEDLRNEKGNTKKLMEDVNYRVAWEKHQKSLRDKEEKEAEKERVAYASIDWHDFVVVQTVDFQPGDTTNLPGLCTPKDVGARILLEAR
ncbi:surp module, partial [Ancylostoma duodenale]